MKHGSLAEHKYLRQHCKYQNSHQYEAEHDQILQVKSQGRPRKEN